MIRDGSGILVPPRDPAALADAIQQIAQMSPEAREAMGHIGRGFIVEDCDSVKSTERLLGLIRAAEQN
jgi:glycosyltransferase involved in cell wall biosynthesis